MIKKFILFILISSVVFGWNSSSTANPVENWLIVEIGIIGTASEDILEQALEQARDTNRSGVIIQLDTPGGALENTRSMVKLIMASEIPVVVFVGPAGSRAGSAGAFITIAGHVAAMAPGTNIGAAHPVQASGKDVEEGEIERKVMNDTLAFIESIAAEREVATSKWQGPSLLLLYQ
jgi:membrane-bound serine protease (ClpP class)